jgi:hypothetical protein
LYNQSGFEIKGEETQMEKRQLGCGARPAFGPITKDAEIVRKTIK